MWQAPGVVSGPHQLAGSRRRRSDRPQTIPFANLRGAPPQPAAPRLMPVVNTPIERFWITVSAKCAWIMRKFVPSQAALATESAPHEPRSFAVPPARRVSPEESHSAGCWTLRVATKPGTRTVRVRRMSSARCAMKTVSLIATRAMPASSREVGPSSAAGSERTVCPPNASGQRARA